MPGDDDNISEYFGSHKDKEYILNEQDIERDYKNLAGKNLDTRSPIRDNLSRRTSEGGLLASELSLSLEKGWV